MSKTVLKTIERRVWFVLSLSLSLAVFPFKNGKETERNKEGKGERKTRETKKI